jgi:hypothetical protein
MKRLLITLALLSTCVPAPGKDRTDERRREAAHRLALRYFDEFEVDNGPMRRDVRRALEGVKTQSEALDLYVTQLSREIGADVMNPGGGRESVASYVSKTRMAFDLRALRLCRTSAEFESRERTFITDRALRYYWVGIHHRSYYYPSAKNGGVLAPGHIYGSAEELRQYVDDLRSEVRTLRAALVNGGQIRG